MLNWASLGGGFRLADTIVNCQIDPDDRAATASPRLHLNRLVRAIGRDPRYTVGLMTGAEVGRAGVATQRRGGLIIGAWCTAGCTNALRVGDPATAAPAGAGTINIIAAINRPLTRAAMVEAIQIAVEARVAAMAEAGVASVVSGLQATGTGTDCIAVAAPPPRPANRAETVVYCGKHTVAGQLIGRAVMRACADALAGTIATSAK